MQTSQYNVQLTLLLNLLLNLISKGGALSKKFVLSFLPLCLIHSPQFLQAKVIDGDTDSAQTIKQRHKNDCGRDSFEPNDQRSRARNLSQELNADREINAHICADDQDWYTVWLNRGELVEFIISSAIDKAPKLSVYAPRKRKASGIHHRVSPGTSKLRLYAKQSGRYRLHVKALRSARSDYTLSLHRPSY